MIIPDGSKKRRRSTHASDEKRFAGREHLYAWIPPDSLHLLMEVIDVMNRCQILHRFDHTNRLATISRSIRPSEGCDRCSRRIDVGITSKHNKCPIGHHSSTCTKSVGHRFDGRYAVILRIVKRCPSWSTGSLKMERVIFNFIQDQDCLFVDQLHHHGGNDRVTVDHFELIGLRIGLFAQCQGGKKEQQSSCSAEQIKCGSHGDDCDPLCQKWR